MIGTSGTVPALVVAAGLAVGSFLNVCIHRLPRGESVVTPSSRCPRCRQPVRWVDNVPVISYVMLRGRCRHCAAPIGAWYPAVELATAGLFLVQYLAVGWQPLLAVRLLFTSAMVVLFATDLRHRVLPNVITVPGVVVGLACAWWLPPGWWSALLGVMMGGGSLLALSEVYYRIRGEAGLGMGDVKLLAMVGAFVGWAPMVLALLIASLVGSMVGIALIASTRADRRYPLPFGSFLAAAAVLVTLVGDEVIAWYVALL